MLLDISVTILESIFNTLALWLGIEEKKIGKNVQRQKEEAAIRKKFLVNWTSFAHTIDSTLWNYKQT